MAFTIEKFHVTRQAVYKALDSERDYQDAKWGHTETCGQHSITEFIAFMQDYLQEAQHILSRESVTTGNSKAMDIMRKVTAMGVSCMEQNGAPLRQAAAHDQPPIVYVLKPCPSNE